MFVHGCKQIAKRYALRPVTAYGYPKLSARVCCVYVEYNVLSFSTFSEFRPLTVIVYNVGKITIESVHILRVSTVTCTPKQPCQGAKFGFGLASIEPLH